MKQKPLLLLALSLMLLQSCLGAPQVTEPAPNPNGQTAAPTDALPSSTPQPTPLPSHLAQLRVAITQHEEPHARLRCGFHACLRMEAGRASNAGLWSCSADAFASADMRSMRAPS